MENNVGDSDRNIRFIAAAVIMLIGLLNNSWWGLIIGLIPLATALFGWCPAYTFLGKNTNT